MPSEVMQPGRSLVQGARSLEARGRATGKWPYQWLFPGPNSRQVTQTGTVASPGPGVTAEIMRYTVPDGLIFSLRGVCCGFFGTGWDEGTGDLLFTLSVVAAGSRNVDYFANVKTRLGSTTQPFPILGRLEFEPTNVLIWTVFDVANVLAGLPNNMFGAVVGHTYPQSEAA